MSLFNTWNYRKKITLTGQTGAGSNYQVLLKVGESSGAAGEDFDVEGNSEDFPSAKNDSGDLRFTDSTKSVSLDFWVQEVTGVTPNRLASIWVEVTADLGSDVNIFCYYGKSGASNVSSGDDTFIFFDDFEGDSLDTNKWTQTDTQYTGATGTRTTTIANSIMQIDSRSNDYTWLARTISSNDSFTMAKRELIGVHKTNYGGIGGSDWRAWSISQSGATSSLYFGGGENGLVFNHSNNSGSASSGTIEDQDAWTDYALRRYSCDTNVTFLKNGTSIYSSASYVPNTAGNINFATTNWSANSITTTAYVDWIAIKNFINTEPSFDVAGVEEPARDYNSSFLLNFI